VGIFYTYIFFSTSSHEKRVRILRLNTLPEDPACFDMLGTMLGTPCSTIEFVSNPPALARTKITVPVVTAVTDAVTSVLIKDVVNHIVFHLLVTAATLTVTAVLLRYLMLVSIPRLSNEVSRVMISNTGHLKKNN
jgi:hypothetical protein